MIKEKDFGKITDYDFCEPIPKSVKGIIGVYRSRSTGRMERFGIETDCHTYLRIYQDDIDGGSDFVLPEGMVKELFAKLKKINQ